MSEDQSNEILLRYEETDETGKPTGRSISYSGVEFQPLGYADLMDKNLDQTITVPLTGINARVVETNIPGISVDAVGSMEFTLQSPYTSKTIGLVKGGWLPSGLALQANMTIFPDRCTVSEITGRFIEGRKRRGHDQDLLDLFSEARIRINPSLYALEGNLRCNPTPEVVEQQLVEAYEKVKSALPLAMVVPEDIGGLRGIIGIIEDTQAGMASRGKFLLRLARTVRSPVGARRKAAVWAEVIAAADDCHVPRSSLPVLAAMSAIVVPNGKSPARRVLKLGNDKYTEQDAYNALADLRALEILMRLFAVFPDERIMLCTSDKHLALFWVGLQASKFFSSGKTGGFRASPFEHLLPGVTPEEMASLVGPDY